MGLVDRFRIGKHLRTLKGADRASESALTEAKSALRAVGPGALPSLFDLLPDRTASAAAREVLSYLLTDDTLGEFLEAAARPDRVAQKAVVEILQTGQRYHPERLLDFLAASDSPRAQIEAVLLERGKDLSSRKLLQLLPDLERDARTIVYRVVEKICDDSVAPEAAALATNTDWWIRLHMAQLLGRLGGDAAEAALTDLLGDRNKNVRLRAVKSLRRLGAKSAVPSLVKVLRDGDLTVQAAAIDTLIAIGDAGAVPHLVDVLKDESEQSRRGAVEVLNEVATQEAIQDLVHALRDADWWVRVRAADALGSIGGNRVVDAILTLMDDPDVQIRRYAVEILNTIPDGRSVESLLKALADEDWWVRERSIDALGRTGDVRAVTPLCDLLGSEASVATLCARALGELGFGEAARPLLGVLHSSPDEELQRETVDALAKIARGDLADDLREMLANALKDYGIRVEKTRLQPMEIRAGAAAPPKLTDAISLVLEKPLEPAEAAPSPDLVKPSGEQPGPDAPGPPARPVTPASLPDEVVAGTRILDRYRVIRKIGRGGFATVFLVEDEAITDEVILKILSSHLTADESMAQRFVRELKLARRVSHRNVIRIHDLLEIGRSRAISMEYFPSEDLGDLLDRERILTPERGVGLARQICDGLVAAHEAGVFHRDIKPANILVGENDEVKIVDFGLASVGREVENRLTRTGHLVGTPHYMAPELIRGEDVGASADLYSFGIMMYEMFSGMLPYDGDNAMNILFRHLDGDAKPIREIVPDFPEALEAVVLKAMSLETGDRHGSIAELLAELEQVST